MIGRSLCHGLFVVAIGLLGFAQESQHATRSQTPDTNNTDLSSLTMAAEVDGRLFTLDEVDGVIARQLQDLEERKYQLRRAALEQRVNQFLLENAAQVKGLTIPSFILSRVPAVSESEVEAAYRANKDRLSADTDFAVKEQIRESLQKDARQRAYRDTIRELRSRTVVSIFLRRPEISPDLFRTLTGPIVGPDTAPVRLVVFSDYQCGFCRKSQDTLNTLLSKYDRQIQLVHKFLVHKDNATSVLMAKAALCAGQQQAFWRYHHTLFSEGAIGSVQWLSDRADANGLDRRRFDSCLASDEPLSVLERDRKDAALVDARGTPFFLLNGQVFRGMQPLEELDQAISQLLPGYSLAGKSRAARGQEEQ